MPFDASTINWSAAGQVLANGVILALDDQRRLTIVAERLRACYLTRSSLIILLALLLVGLSLVLLLTMQRHQRRLAAGGWRATAKHAGDTP